MSKLLLIIYLALLCEFDEQGQQAALTQNVLDIFECQKAKESWCICNLWTCTN